MSIISWLTASTTNPEMPDIYPFSVNSMQFVKTDVENLYSKILTDVLERTQGISDEKQILLWDNCLASESQDGLVTMLSKAMANKSELFLIFDKSTNLIRKAKPEEEVKIRESYAKKADVVKTEAGTAIFITFKNYGKTDMINIYSQIEFCTVASLYKMMNLSKAIQLKMTDLRSSVALGDKIEAKSQAKAMAEGLRDGKDVLMDAKDILETAKPDLTATQTSFDMNAQKMSRYVGMPASYITGIQPKGLGDSGEGDAKAVERGLKNYYFSIIKPVIDSLFEVKSSFKSEDFRLMSSALEALKTFEITSDELMSKDNKRKLINKMVGLPENEMGDAPEKVKVLPDPKPNPVPPRQGA